MMQTRYLDWYKALMPRIHGGSEVISLMSSSVPEPWDLIHQLTESCQDTFRRLLNIPNPWGHPELLDRIAEKYNVSSDRLVLTQGATNAIFLICQTLLKSGNHVLVENPHYEPLRDTPELMNADIELFQRNPLTGALDPKILRDRLRPSTRLIILTNSHNPTGAILTTADLNNIMESASRISPDIRILVDEVYLDFQDTPTTSAALLDPRFITVSSLTKVYGLSFLRCGWICTVPELCHEIRWRQILTDGIGSIYLESLSALVFSELARFYSRSRSRVDGNREIVRKYITPLISDGVLDGQIPHHGCICFLRLNTEVDTDGFLADLDEKHNILLVPGRFFGDPDAFRLGFGGDPDDLEKGLNILSNLLG